MLLVFFPLNSSKPTQERLPGDDVQHLPCRKSQILKGPTGPSKPPLDVPGIISAAEEVFVLIGLKNGFTGCPHLILPLERARYLAIHLVILIRIITEVAGKSVHDDLKYLLSLCRHVKF